MRRFIGILLTLFAFALTTEARAEIVLKDIKGRTVTLAHPAQRLVIDDGRMILALSFLTKDPAGLIAAWPHDVDRLGREFYASYAAKFPSLDKAGRTTGNTQEPNVEQIIAIAPDAVLASSVSRISETQLQQLANGGIPVIFVDFVTDPLINTDRSLEVIGKAIGHEREATQAVALRSRIRSAITERLVSAPASQKPVVLMETHASVEDLCCNSPGRAGIGRFLDAIGAHNVGEVLGAKPSGKLDIEYVLKSAPQVYIATGGEYMKARGGLLVGPHFSEAETAASMQALLQRPGFSALSFGKGSVHGLSHQLFNSPLDILALQLIARWSRPDLFSDIDIETTRRDLDAIMAVPLAGSFWTR